MRIIVDTNVLYDSAAIMALDDDVRPKILPAVVFLERARQLHRDRKVSVEEVRATFERSRWRIEEFGAEQAMRIGARIADDSTWRRHYRDAMIAGHVEEWDELWTSNAKDFLAVGLDARHIVDLTRAGSPVPEA
jgi:predicted nucleic acid-binding protein